MRHNEVYRLVVGFAFGYLWYPLAMGGVLE